MNSSVQQIFCMLGNSQKLFNHFQKQQSEVFHKEVILKHFVVFTGQESTWGLFFNKVAGHWVCTNNQQKIYSDRIYKPLSQKTFHVMFLIKKRSADVQYLISNFIIRSTEAAICRCSSKQVFLKSCNIHKKALVLEPLFNTIAVLQPCNYVKK